MKEILIQTRIKNNRLLKTILSRFESVSEFALTTKIAANTLYALIGLNYSPYSTRGGLTKNGQTIEAALEKPAEFLFPIDLYIRTQSGNRCKSMARSFEVSLNQMRSIAFGNTIPDREIGVEQMVSNSNRLDVVNKSLSQDLTDRERNVIEMRFGFKTGIPLSLKDAGKEINVTPERIRQIEQKAIRKLSNPRRSKNLRHLDY